MLHSRPSRNRGRRECRVHERTHCLACKTKRRTQANHRYAEITPALPAQWLYGLLRDLPGVPGLLASVADRSLALRPQGRKSHLDRLDPSVGGTGPRGLTVRVVPHVLRQNTSIATRLPSGDEWPNVPRGEAG